MGLDKLLSTRYLVAKRAIFARPRFIVVRRPQITDKSLDDSWQAGKVSSSGTRLRLKPTVPAPTHSLLMLMMLV